MLKLNKVQQKIVMQRSIGQTVLKGGINTHIGIGRMLYLVNHKCQSHEQVALITADEKAAQKANILFNEEYSMQTISLFENENVCTQILSIDALMMNLYGILFGTYKGKVIEKVPENILQKGINITKKDYPRVKFLNESNEGFICDELNWISSCNVKSLEEYLMLDRRGCKMKLPKKGKGRQAIWQIKNIVNEELKAIGCILKLDLEAQVLLHLENIKVKFKHMIVEDVTRFTKVQLMVLKALYGKGDLLFLMDEKPCEIYTAWLKRGQSFKQVGFDMTGRIRKLNRTSERKKTKRNKKQIILTPLEIFMDEVARVKQVVKEKPQTPYYVETYKYVNKLTGIETVFQKDTSAGETYIDEVKQEEVASIPLYTSDIAAGAPIEVVEEMSEMFEVPSDLLGNYHHTYMLHVQGDSMIGADIEDGDYVVIQAGNVNNNEIAAVYYNGATTLKRIVQEREHILLVSENSKYPPIVIEDSDFRVMGKLIGVIKYYNYC